MAEMQELIELETQGWQALSSEGEAGKDFYSVVLHENAVMVFPGGLRIVGKAKILQSIAARPWKSFEIEDERTLALSEAAAVLIYRVVAQREEADPYIALISSTYVRGDRAWKLILHQQTPV